MEQSAAFDLSDAHSSSPQEVLTGTMGRHQNDPTKPRLWINAVYALLIVLLVWLGIWGLSKALGQAGDDHSNPPITLSQPTKTRPPTTPVPFVVPPPAKAWTRVQPAFSTPTVTTTSTSTVTSTTTQSVVRAGPTVTATEWRTRPATFRTYEPGCYRVNENGRHSPMPCPTDSMQQPDPGTYSDGDGQQPGQMPSDSVGR